MVHEVYTSRGGARIVQEWGHNLNQNCTWHILENQLFKMVKTYESQVFVDWLAENGITLANCVLELVF